MNNNPISSEKSLQDYYNRVSTKIRAGFTVKEKTTNYPLLFCQEKPEPSITHLILCCFV